MKKLNTLFLLFFVIQSYAQDAEQNITTVPENPESLVGDSIDIQSNTIENLQKAQAQIDKLDAESKKLTNEYKDTIVEYEILNKYDNQLEKITINQAEEIANITRQIDDLDETNKYVLPLLERMVKTLRELIEIDVPFLADERYARLGELEDILVLANDRIFVESLPYRPETAILTGEVKQEKLIIISAEQRQSLAEAIYGQGGTIIVGQSDPSQLFVIRELAEKNIVAYHLDSSNPARLTLATRFELRPNDIIFVAPQFVTNYNRALMQIVSAYAVTKNASLE